MSEDDADVEDGDDRPDIEEDEVADVDADDLDALAEEIEDDVADDDGDDQDDGDDDQEGTAPNPDAAGGTGRQWGEMYVSVLTTAANSIIEKHGDEDATKVSESQAYDLNIDEYANETLEEMGMADDMPPQQALVISSVLFAGAAVFSETDLVERKLAEGGA